MQLFFQLKLLIMHTIRTLLHKGLSWIALESMTTQTLLALHTIALFRTISLEMYGTIGIIYSLCYLIASLATAGLDSTLGSMRALLNSQNNVQRIMKEQSLYTALIIVVGCIIVWYIYGPFIQNHKVLSCILLCIIGAEATKKTLKSYCALLGNFKTPALIEVGLVTSYIGMLWGIYLIHQSFNLYTLFIPLLISTGISTFYFCYELYKQYTKLPVTSSSLYTPSAWPRLHGLFVHSNHYIFSGNVLVPLAASTLGLSYAALLKLLSNCMHTIITNIEKMFGLTSTVLFAHTKNKQYVLLLIMRYVLPFVLISFSIGMYAIHTFLSYKQSLDLFPLACAYILIHVTHVIALTYERLLLDRNKGLILLYITVLTSLLSFSIWHIQSGMYTSFLLYCALSRILYLLSLMMYSYATWRIVPYGSLSFRSLYVPMILFLIVYFYR